MTFSKYYGKSNVYELNVKIEHSNLRLWLSKDGNGIGSNTLDYKEWSETIEEIPVSFDGGNLIINSSPEKRMPFTTLLMYKEFDIEKCTVT